MSYQALYRTYRPQTFNKVIGQETIVKTLQNAIVNNKISHAYLFCGPRGTGKTSVARIFAKALNCTNVKANGEPCCECYVCKEISEGINPDVIEIDAASNNGVDEIRDIRERVKFLPSGSKYKIYIIDEVHMLSTGAFNALLKILEEPPKHVIFILATTEPQKIPSTIISRCQRFEFKPINVDKISKSLREVCDNEKVTISDEAIDLIGEIADGGMRDALSILDQTISYGSKEITIDEVNTITGSINAEIMCNLMLYIDSKDANSALDVVNSLIKEGKEINKIVNGMLLFCRDLMLFKSVGNKKINKYIFEKEKFQNLAFKIANTKIIFFIEVLCDIQNKIKYSNSPGIYLEIAIIRMSSISNEELNIIKRMDDLENKIMDTTFSGEYNNSVDNEKIKSLDNRLNQVVSELNKLELPALSKKVNDIELTVNEHQNKFEADSKTSSSVRLTELESDVTSKFVDIEAKINALENGYKIENIDNNKSSDIDSKAIKDIDDIKKEIQELKKSTSNEDIEAKINNLQEQLAKIKDEFDNESKDINNANSVVFNDNENLKEIEIKINCIQDKLSKLEKEYSDIVIQDSSIDDGLNEKINVLEQKLKELDLNKTEHNEYKDKIESIKEDIKSEISSQFINFEHKESLIEPEISQRIEKLESQIYELTASKLALEEKIKTLKPEKQEKVKTLKRPKGQMSLFDFDISIEKDFRSDFGELAQDEEIENNENSVKEESVNQNKIATQEISIIENEVLEAETIEETENNEYSVEAKNVTQDMTLIQETSDTENEVLESKANDEAKTEEKLVYKQTSLFDFDIKNDDNSKTASEIIDNKEADIKEGLFDDSEVDSHVIDKQVIEVKEEESQQSIDFKPIEKDTLVNQFYDENNHEEVINKTRSSLVIKDVGLEEKQEPKQKEIIIPADPEANDKFAKYNIEDLEKLLYDAQERNAKNDKARILEIWKTLTRGVDPSMYSVALSLSQGKIEAVGNKEFVISYPNITRCNEVMRGGFKSKALKFLYSKLNGNYNYLALPIDVWLSKREEYVGQYQMGVKKAKLSPFNISGLNVEEIALDEDKNKEKIEQTIRMFGDDVVKIK